MSIIELLGEGGGDPKLRKSNIVLVIVLPMVGQKCWKKSGGFPSGPRNFKGYICFKAENTFVVEKAY